MTTKFCPGCNQERDTAMFRQRHDRPGKLQSWCKVCEAKYKQAAHRRKHPDRPPRIPHTEPYHVRLKRARFAQIMGVSDAHPETG